MYTHTHARANTFNAHILASPRRARRDGAMFIVWVVHTRLARDERARSGHKIYNMRSRQRDAMRERIHVHVFARERAMHFDIDFNLLIRSERRRGECVFVCVSV